MWSSFAQSGANPTAIAALVSAVSGVVLGAVSLWRARSSDQRDEISKLWDENRKLRSEVNGLHDAVDGLRRQVRECESDKDDMARRLAEVGL